MNKKKRKDNKRWKQKERIKDKGSKKKVDQPKNCFNKNQIMIKEFNNKNFNDIWIMLIII